MLDEQITRDINNNLNKITGELGEVKAKLQQYEKSIETLNKKTERIYDKIGENNVTIARAVGFVGGVSFVVSIITTVGLHYFKII